jgi:hypothetical protein
MVKIRQAQDDDLLKNRFRDPSHGVRRLPRKHDAPACGGYRKRQPSPEVDGYLEGTTPQRAAATGRLQSDGDAMLGEVLLHLRDGELAIVEDAGGEDGVGFALVEDGGEVAEFPRAAAGDDRDGHQFADEVGDFEVVAGLHAVRVDAVEDDFAGAEGHGLFGPRARFPRSAIASAAREDGPFARRGFLGVDGDDHALIAEGVCSLGDDFRTSQGRGIEADFIRTRTEEDSHILNGTDAAANGEWHEAAVGRAFDHVDDRFAALGRGGDVEEDEFVGALLIIANGKLDRIADVAQAVVFRPSELLAAGDESVVDVETGNDTFGEHGQPNLERREFADKLIDLLGLGLVLDGAIEPHQHLGIGEKGHDIDFPVIAFLDKREAQGRERPLVIDLRTGAIALDRDRPQVDLLHVARIEKMTVGDALHETAEGQVRSQVCGHFFLQGGAKQEIDAGSRTQASCRGAEGISGARVQRVQVITDMAWDISQGPIDLIIDHVVFPRGEGLRNLGLLVGLPRAAAGRNSPRGDEAEYHRAKQGRAPTEARHDP